MAVTAPRIMTQTISFHKDMSYSGYLEKGSEMEQESRNTFYLFGLNENIFMNYCTMKRKIS